MCSNTNHLFDILPLLALPSFNVVELLEIVSVYF